jgi:predicted transcriptional regulator
MEGNNSNTKNTDKQIQGNTQSDIAKTLHVGEATVSRDISSLRQQAQINLKTHINDKLYGWNKSGVRNMLGDSK